MLMKNSKELIKKSAYEKSILKDSQTIGGSFVDICINSETGVKM